jgi:hypothetical protein
VKYCEAELELSMEMSVGFKEAITQGGDEVRIGSTILGESSAKKDAVIVEGGQENIKRVAVMNMSLHFREIHIKVCYHCLGKGKTLCTIRTVSKTGSLH